MPMKKRDSGADAYPMIAVADALAQVLSAASALPAETVPLARALGRIAAADVVAADPLPPFAASVKDGYAVIAADGAGTYPVAASITAGAPQNALLQPGQIAYITTGAPLPVGADAVIQVEDTERLEMVDGVEQVRLLHGVQAGNDVRPIGADVAAGAVVVRAGERFGAAEIGLAATVGATQVSVHGRPRVGVLSTGNELVAADAPLVDGAIRDSNGPMLRAAVEAAGGEVVDLGIARDDAQVIRSIFQSAQRECAILISTGGVSMGELDLMKHMAEELGTVHFGRLLMKPGKPCTFATLPRAEGTGVADHPLLYFGLPGNPVSGMVTFLLLVLPAIRSMAGSREPALQRVQAVLRQPMRLDATRPEYHRAHARWDATLHDGAGGWLAESTGNQMSSRLLSFRNANMLLELPVGTDELPVGSVVDALLLD